MHNLQFGKLLEQDIREAIIEANLAHITLNDVVIKTNDSWCQIDHLIITPNTLYIIEAKNTTKQTYIVKNDLDYYQQDDSFTCYKIRV